MPAPFTPGNQRRDRHPCPFCGTPGMAVRVDHSHEQPLPSERPTFFAPPEEYPKHWWRDRLITIAILLIIALILAALWYAPSIARAKPRPVPIPAELQQARDACPNGTSLAACRGELRRAYAAVRWQKKQSLELARQMVGKLTDWTCIHQGEGAWNATGHYHGGLQMDWTFMRTYGRDMLHKHGGVGAEAWTPREQIIVAQRAYAQGRGYNPWPNTSRACGLR